MRPVPSRGARSPSRAHLAILALAALLAPAGASAQAVKATYGDWQLRCDTPAGAKAEQCAAVQSVAAEDRPNITLLVIVLRTADARKAEKAPAAPGTTPPKPADAKEPAAKAEATSRILRVVAPLGVLLPAGLGLKVDDADIGRAGFVRCVGSGCVAEVVMDDVLLGKLKNGKTATFIVFQEPDEGIGIPVSLDGFAAAFDGLS